MSDLRASDLTAVVEEASRLGVEVTRVFGGLSGEPLNWKPAEGEWSVGQCFDHLVISNRPFAPLVEEILAGRHRPTLWERVPVLPGLFGKLLIDSLRPDSGRKIKARPAFLPSRSHIAAEIIAVFGQEQERLLRLMEASRRLDLERIIVTSPVLRVITYSLMDAYRIIVAHEQNHIAQARRVMETPGFPRC